MPCYTAWNANLSPGTPEYVRAEAEVKEKLQSIKHIVDYYYRANSFDMPNLPEGVAIDAFRQPRSAKESAIREAICHHFACDAVDVSSRFVRIQRSSREATTEPARLLGVTGRNALIYGKPGKLRHPHPRRRHRRCLPGTSSPGAEDLSGYSCAASLGGFRTQP